MQKIMIATEGGGLNSRNVVMVIVKKKNNYQKFKKDINKEKNLFHNIIIKICFNIYLIHINHVYACFRQRKIVFNRAWFAAL